ncbi:MAG: hypothetical protein EPN74_02365 [Rhodanobacter sp.]|nr:MAG: hypothetical protein EPN74_02365 [Rhodanobacter sp.]
MALQNQMLRVKSSDNNEILPRSQNFLRNFHAIPRKNAENNGLTNEINNFLSLPVSWTGPEDDAKKLTTVCISDLLNVNADGGEFCFKCNQGCSKRRRRESGT